MYRLVRDEFVVKRIVYGASDAKDASHEIGALCASLSEMKNEYKSNGKWCIMRQFHKRSILLEEYRMT